MAAPRTSVDQLYWAELSSLTKARFALALIVLPVAVGLYGHFEWAAALGNPWGGLAGFVAGAALGVLIRPRRQANR